VRLEVGGRAVPATFDRNGDRITVRPESPVRLEAGQVLKVTAE
jgi:hypothetical protein